MRDFLNRVNIANFDAGSYIDRVSQNASELPNIGMAFSGGGWRALQAGAGVLKAFDGRTENATESGRLGGLLQSATYVAGLSGGSWLVGSIYINNFTTVSALQADDSGNLWEFGNSVLQGPAEGGIQILNTAGYYGSLFDDVEAKENAGFNASLTDYWARALSFQMINGTDEDNARYTWSSIALMQDFQAANQPFPIVVADGRAPGEKLISLNSTNYEFNPFEMGTWDPTTYGFVPLQYIGTNLTNGEVVDDSRCIVGFDNAGFIMGTSSSLFNQIILELNLDNVPSALRGLVNSTLNALDDGENDIADYTPNPFYRYNPTGNSYNADNIQLTLVDGGEDLQNIPLNPLIQPERHVDVIFAVDSSADVNNWPNATALVATYERSLGDISNGTGFPAIPDQNTIVNLGLNTHPTFFGCNASNMTDGLNVPLIVYIPNSPYVAFSNVSTFQLTTNNTFRDAIILNGYNVATMANGTLNDESASWPACVGCAIISRSLERTGTDIPQQCQQCFQQYCWNGTLDSSTPPTYAPALRLEDQAVDIQSAGNVSGARAIVAVAVAALATLALGL
jgi:lysophospholipase